MAVQQQYVNGKAFDFASAEIDIGTEIFQKFEGISYKQPIEEEWLWGTAAEPLDRTRGQLQPGDGELKFSSIEEAQMFVDKIGDGYLEKEWSAAVTFSMPGRPAIRHVLIGCRLLDVQDDHSSGSGALKESMPFSFRRMTRNGRTALINQRST